MFTIKTSSTTLRIDNDVYFDLGKTSGSGTNANKVTITKNYGVEIMKITVNDKTKLSDTLILADYAIV